MRRAALLLLLIITALSAGVALASRERMARCERVPLLAENLLPNAALSRSAADAPLPDGWSAAAPGVALHGPAIDGEGFDLDGDGRALQLIGIGNELLSPPAPVAAGRAYCFAGRALTDSDKRSATRLRAALRWLDAEGRTIAEDVSVWQPVALWQPDAPPRDWSPVLAAGTAPAGAASLQVALQPSSDDRVYLDAMALRATVEGGRSTMAGGPSPAADRPSPVTIEPWPNGARAALSFSFDWETAMGGLVHSRSVDDPHADEDPLLRAMRMREGVTTTLEIFRPLGIRATYYANGYNFLLGNRERRTFMGDPTFAWARAEPPYRWQTDLWATTPWFASDPYGTVQSDPAWYFGDLLPALLAGGHDIQSHTFSHFHGGFASPEEWRADLAAWRDVAQERGVAMARSLAFPWSGSAGMADASWVALEEAGITSVTRTNWSQRQYRIVSADDPRCRPVPGHERILACPDFYLTAGSALTATAVLERAIAARGMIDLWAHTEEVTAPEQVAAWRGVAEEAARRRDAGELWIAPLAEIADWQQALGQVRVTGDEPRADAGGESLRLSVANASDVDLNGLTLRLPRPVGRVAVGGAEGRPGAVRGDTVVLDVPAGATLEITVWFA